MKLVQTHLIACVAALLAAGLCSAQTSPPSQAPGAKAMEQQLQKDSTAMSEMTAAQSAKYRAVYDTAKAKWASMTPQEKQATIAAAKTKKLADLAAIELVGQRDDMRSETAAQGAQYRAEAEAAKAKWDRLTPAQEQAVRKSAWQKKRAELDAMEAVVQRDDTYVLPY